MQGSYPSNEKVHTIKNEICIFIPSFLTFDLINYLLPTMLGHHAVWHLPSNKTFYTFHRDRKLDFMLKYFLSWTSSDGAK